MENFSFLLEICGDSWKVLQKCAIHEELSRKIGWYCKTPRKEVGKLMENLGFSFFFSNI
jgi:hypothetical protein